MKRIIYRVIDKIVEYSFDNNLACDLYEDCFSASIGISLIIRVIKDYKTLELCFRNIDGIYHIESYYNCYFESSRRLETVILDPSRFMETARFITSLIQETFKGE